MNLLAGMPCIVKPATVTSYLTEVVVKEIIASKILPEGALQLVCGSAGDLLDHVTSQDVVTFTGSATTGLMLKSNQHILRESVPFTMEADSLNCIVGDKKRNDLESRATLYRHPQNICAREQNGRCVESNWFFVITNGNWKSTKLNSENGFIGRTVATQ